MNHNTFQAIKSLGTGIWLHQDFPNDASWRKTALLDTHQACEHLLKAKLRGDSSVLTFENQDIIELINHLNRAGFEIEDEHYQTLTRLHWRKTTIDQSYEPSSDDAPLLESSFAFCLEFMASELDINFAEWFSEERLRDLPQQIYTSSQREKIAKKRQDKLIESTRPKGDEESMCVGKTAKLHATMPTPEPIAPEPQQPKLVQQPKHPQPLKQPKPLFSPAVLALTGVAAGVLLAMIIRPRF